jgi:hypothetical protein
VEQIRVAVAEVPGVLRGIIEHVIGAEPGLRLMPEPQWADAPPSPVDVVVLALDNGTLPERWRARLYASPRVKLVVVSGDGRQAALYELVPQRSPINKVSPTGLVEAIRAAASTPAAGDR